MKEEEYTVVEKGPLQIKGKRGLTTSSGQPNQYSIYSNKRGFVADIRDSGQDNKEFANLLVDLLNQNKKYYLPSEIKIK